MLVLLAVARAEEPVYPTRAVDRPLVLPKGVGRVTLESTVYSTVDDVHAEWWSGLQASLGLGRLELGLASGARLAPGARWAGTLWPSVRASVVDEAAADWAPGLVVTVVPEGVWGYVHVLVDPGVRWVFLDGLALELGHREDLWRLWNASRQSQSVGLAVDATLVWQAAEPVALSAGGSLGTFDFRSFRFDWPITVAPGGALGATIVPVADVDVDSAIAFHWYPPRDEASSGMASLDLRVGVTTRW